MLWFLVGVILVLFLFVNQHHLEREGFLSLPNFLGGSEIMNINPLFGDNTCQPSEEMDAGLCYTKCNAGYHGIGPVCWADTDKINIGVPVLLEPCDKGGRKSHNLPELPFPDHGDYKDDGLTCRQPLTGGDCSTHCDGNWNWNDGGFCHTHCNPIRGGNVVGRLNNGGICPDDHPDKVDGMCYPKCTDPTKTKHYPGMPYLCYVGGNTSYGRGVGKVPYMVRIAGKYGFLGRMN